MIHVWLCKTRQEVNKLKAEKKEYLERVTRLEAQIEEQKAAICMLEIGKKWVDLNVEVLRKAIAGAEQGPVCPDNVKGKSAHPVRSAIAKWRKWEAGTGLGMNRKVTVDISGALPVRCTELSP